MLIPVTVFALVLLIVLGAYYVGVVKPEIDEREVVARRLGDRPARRKKALSLERSSSDVSSVAFLDRLLAPYARLTRPIDQRIEHADMKMTVGALLALCGLVGVLAYAVVWTLTSLHMPSLGAAALATLVPYWFVGFKARQRINTFEEQFPEAIDLISRALRAGHAFPTALSMVADEAPQPVGGEFKRLHDEQNFGRPLPEAMQDFAQRIPVLDAKFFVTAVLTQRESGGNLSEVLDNLARVIRERFKVKRQIRVISAHGRMTAAVLIALPPFLAVCFMISSPGHLATMTADPLGRLMIGAAVVLQVVGSFIIKKLVNIEY